MSIHDIKVDKIGASFDNFANFLTHPAEIR
jgi:hypothetical protein